LTQFILQYREIKNNTKNKPPFPADEALLKSVHLALRGDKKMDNDNTKVEGIVLKQDLTISDNSPEYKSHYELQFLKFTPLAK